MLNNRSVNLFPSPPSTRYSSGEFSDSTCRILERFRHFQGFNTMPTQWWVEVWGNYAALVGCILFFAHWKDKKFIWTLRGGVKPQSECTCCSEKVLLSNRFFPQQNQDSGPNSVIRLHAQLTEWISPDSYFGEIWES